MKYLCTLIIFAFFTGTAMAQNRFGSTNGVGLSDFQNTTYIQFDENTHKLFWAINLNAFNASQKTSFQELVFNSELLVACSTPDANHIWYLSSSKSTEVSLVIVELNKLVDKARNLTTTTQDKYQ